MMKINQMVDLHRVRLRVDDREVASGTLGEQNTIGTASSQLFIGGFPDRVKPSANEMPIAEPMIGCVSNIFIDYRLVHRLFSLFEGKH